MNVTTTAHDTTAAPTTVAPLNLVRLELIESKVASYVRRRCRQSLDAPDLRYTVHMALEGLDIGDFVRPFQIQRPRGGVIPILAYGRPEKRIRNYLTLSTDVDMERLMMLDLSTLMSKPMPYEFAPGEEFNFEVEVVPTYRYRDAEGKEREKDAFLIEKATNPEVTRDAAYLKWLASREGRLRGAEVFDLTFDDLQFPKNFLRAQLRKGETERRINCPRLPNATFKGRLRVTDPAAFLATVSQGVGAHHHMRGFGFLKLFPCM